MAASSRIGYTMVASIADNYVVLGLPPGTPLDIEAEVIANVTGQTFGGGSFLGCGIDFVGDALPDPGNISYWRTLFPVGGVCPPESYRVANHVVSGQPFYLKHTLRFGPSVTSFGSAVSQLSFRGLPPGAIVTSCNGYSQGGPTPVRRSSWGAIKLVYH